MYKVEGAVNFALYDMLNGKFYQFTPEGSVEEFRKLLLDLGLIFETEGAVPNKIMRKDMWDIQHYLRFRVLQVRLNGSGEDNCWNRKKRKRERQYISNETLSLLSYQCRYIPIETIRVEAEEADWNQIEKIVSDFACDKIELCIEEEPDQTKLELLQKKNPETEIIVLPERETNITDFEVGIFEFFYAGNYNLCLGQQVAIDCNGEIKCCLWSDEVLGNILADDLKDMIIRGCFDKYWGATKETVEGCKDCELRFACKDCRLSALSESGRIDAKPSYCQYDPYTGD